jgi:3-deoxy-manno-octulosonate cytidylyltransferase (CMP-KDO synthetase)
MTPRTVVVIPARMASSRFPGKPLVAIGGLPMIEHVRRRACLARGVDEVVVATCDIAIRDEVRRHGGLAVMTADTHERCTDRVEEALRSLTGDLVIIVQGDEPLLQPEAVEQVAAPLRAAGALECSNLVSPLSGQADAQNSNIVKAACDVRGRILYFTRAPIPHYQKAVECPVYRQTGIMAFKSDLLRRYATLPQTPFERAEGIDLMRLIEHGIPIQAVPVPYATVGVDRPEDVGAVERLLAVDPQQQSLHQRVTGGRS